MSRTKLPISVAMCTYNGRRFLSEQLASIARQTRLPDEMVVCDDGSTDATAEIVENFARSVPFPVRFIRNPRNLGSTKNFEQAIGLCSGELIALSDQDDIWMPDKLARQAEMLELDPSLGAVFTDAELVDDQSQPIGKRLWRSILFSPQEQTQFMHGDTVPVLLRKNVVTGATLMIRANLQPFFMPIPKIWVHDGWIAWMLSLYSRIGMIHEPLIHYRLHPNQQNGVESLAPSESLSLRQRLEKGKREEPAKFASVARELEQLERRVAAGNGPEVPGLAQGIDFFHGRGEPYTNPPPRIAWILANTRKYHVYDNGWKCWLRDILMALI